MPCFGRRAAPHARAACPPPLPPACLGACSKGNAVLFWDTKVGSMRQDKWSMHTGCPVIRGTKWAGVKWVHAKPFGAAYPEQPLATSGASLAAAEKLLEIKQARPAGGLAAWRSGRLVQGVCSWRCCSVSHRRRSKLASPACAAQFPHPLAGAGGDPSGVVR